LCRTKQIKEQLFDMSSVRLVCLAVLFLSCGIVNLVHCSTCNDIHCCSTPRPLKPSWLSASPAAVSAAGSGSCGVGTSDFFPANVAKLRHQLPAADGLRENSVYERLSGWTQRLVAAVTRDDVTATAATASFPSVPITRPVDMLLRVPTALVQSLQASGKSFVSSGVTLVPIAMLLNVNMVRQPQRWVRKGLRTGSDWAKVGAYFVAGEKFSAVLRQKDDK
jgi:hypothetical protein